MTLYDTGQGNINSSLTHKATASGEIILRPPYIYIYIVAGSNLIDQYQLYGLAVRNIEHCQSIPVQ